MDACVTLSTINVFEHKHRCIFQHFLHICEHVHKCIAEGLFFLSLKYPQQFLHEKFGEVTRTEDNLDIIKDRTDLEVLLFFYDLIFFLRICVLPTWQYWLHMLISSIYHC